MKNKNAYIWLGILVLMGVLFLPNTYAMMNVTGNFTMNIDGKDYNMTFEGIYEPLLNYTYGKVTHFQSEHISKIFGFKVKFPESIYEAIGEWNNTECMITNITEYRNGTIYKEHFTDIIYFNCNNNLNNTKLYINTTNLNYTIIYVNNETNNTNNETNTTIIIPIVQPDSTSGSSSSCKCDYDGNINKEGSICRCEDCKEVCHEMITNRVPEEPKVDETPINEVIPSIVQEKPEEIEEKTKSNLPLIILGILLTIFIIGLILYAKYLKKGEKNEN